MGNVTFECSDLYGNSGGNWIGYIEDQGEVNGNFTEDPCFCDPENMNFYLCADSYCLPGNHPWGCESELIGIFGSGCSECDCQRPTISVVDVPNDQGGSLEVIWPRFNCSAHLFCPPF